MTFEIHTHNNEVITLRRVPNVDSALLATKGYANEHKHNFNTLALYQLDGNERKQIDLSTYDFNRIKRERHIKNKL